MAASIEQLVERAGQLANAGRWDDAEHVWREIRSRDPQHPRALFSLGVHALKRGDGTRRASCSRRAEGCADRPARADDVVRRLPPSRRRGRRARGDRGGADAGPVFPSGAAREGRLARALRHAGWRRDDVRERAQGCPAADALAGEPAARARACPRGRRPSCRGFQRFS